jgi:hypothetical protein
MGGAVNAALDPAWSFVVEVVKAGSIPQVE